MAMKRAERLTTVAGVQNFVLTLWSEEAEARGTPAVYLPIDPEDARQLLGSLDRWLADIERKN
ncbi:hypothetical protein Acid7E03_28510 [Acidisoma sp. 7E03]